VSSRWRVAIQPKTGPLIFGYPGSEKGSRHQFEETIVGKCAAVLLQVRDGDHWRTVEQKGLRIHS
jgi:hypothetical protein